MRIELRQKPTYINRLTIHRILLVISSVCFIQMYLLRSSLLYKSMKRKKYLLVTRQKSLKHNKGNESLKDFIEFNLIYLRCYFFHTPFYLGHTVIDRATTPVAVSISMQDFYMYAML